MLNSYKIHRKSKWIAILQCVIAAIIIYNVTFILNEYLNNRVVAEPSYSIRVVANSNTVEDQQLKEEVATSIYSHIQAQKLYNEPLSSSAGEIYNLISTNYPQIPFQLSFGEQIIPPKLVDNQLYPQKMQQAIIVKIGAGRGDNWFCTVFPGACLRDQEHEDEEEESEEEPVKWLFLEFFKHKPKDED